MAINNVIVQYNGGFLPDILLLTRAPIVVWFDGTYRISLLPFQLCTTLSFVLFCLVSLHGNECSKCIVQR